ncbi:MAG: hypothetical protein KF742_08270 [Cryobacterium sp.]|nr:hypothetical protein [Cryobacterium sp.]MBX3089317.1 hypothetical protein [Cryobacterium sp.]
MRWEQLFDDLESQLELELDSDKVDLMAEEERLRLGRLTVRDRLKALLRAEDKMSSSVAIELAGDIRARIALTAIGRDWFTGDVYSEDRVIANWLIPIEKVVSIQLNRNQIRSSLDRVPKEDERGLSDRLGFGFALRDLARRRCEVELVAGPVTMHGTIDRVGKDHLDLAIHENGIPRRERSVLQYRLVQLGQITYLRL